MLATGRPPTWPELVEITVAGYAFGKQQVIDRASEDGWRWVELGASIELCGLACSEFQTAGLAAAGAQPLPGRRLLRRVRLRRRGSSHWGVGGDKCW